MALNALKYLLVAIGLSSNCTAFLCGRLTACTDCTSGWSLVRCTWCPLTQYCHSSAITRNYCPKEDEITHQRKCPQVPPGEAPTNYNNLFAEQMGLWSSLTYTDPSTADKEGLQKVIQAEMAGNYQLIEFLTVDCNFFMEYQDCVSLIALSHEEKRIVLSFRGVLSNEQLIDLFAIAIMGAVDAKPIGGRAVRYFYNAYRKFHPCVKVRLMSLLASNPGYQLAVTGHSLGGALAQLSAGTLVREGVVPTERLDVYTFGSPRVGDGTFAVNYDLLVKSSYRIVHRTDPVPHLPPTLFSGAGFYHTKREVWFSSKPKNSSLLYTVCQGNEDRSCSNRAHFLCFSPTCLFDYHKTCHIQGCDSYMRSKILSVTQSDGQKTPQGCTSYGYV